MRITGLYSHKNGEKYIKANHPKELDDIYKAVKNINLEEALSKVSHEKTKHKLLFSPLNMNDQIKKFVFKKGWMKPNKKSKKGFTEPRIYFDKNKREFREMDGIKNKVGLEIQFGKYSFMAYDIFSKMPIFKIKGLIDCGIELVLMNSMIKHMSTGVSSFNQIINDINVRGESNLDIPTLILGFECVGSDWSDVERIRKAFIAGSKKKLVNLKGNRPGPKN